MNDEPNVGHPTQPPPDEDAEDFDRLLREWASRPPETTAREAARRLIPALVMDRRRARRALPWWWAAAAMLVVGFSTWQLGDFRRPRESVTEPPNRPRIAQHTTFETDSEPEDDDLLVIPLDSKTTLYLTLPASAAKKGNPT